MSIDLIAALKELEHSSDRLNELTDQATAAVLKVEMILSSFSIGLDVSVKFAPQRESPKKSDFVRNSQLTRIHDFVNVIHNDYRCLEYCRTGKEKQFRIVVRDFSNEIIAWESLPRDLKLQAVTALPNLIREVATQVQTRVERAETALDEVSQLLHDRS